MVPPQMPNAQSHSNVQPPKSWLWRVLRLLADERVVMVTVGLGLISGCAAELGADDADPRTSADGAFTVPKDLSGNPDTPVWRGAEQPEASAEEPAASEPPPRGVAAPRGTGESLPDDAQDSAASRKIQDPAGPGSGKGGERPGAPGSGEPDPGSSDPTDGGTAPPPVEVGCSDDAGCPALANGCIVQTCSFAADGAGTCVAVSFVCECVPGFDAGCDDGDSCSNDACNAVGACVHVASNICDDGAPCTQDACNNSFCSHVNFATGVACEDGNVCTLDETCKGGQCIIGAIADCNDGDPCTFDVCDNVKGCGHNTMDTEICGG